MGIVHPEQCKCGDGLHKWKWHTNEDYRSRRISYPRRKHLEGPDDGFDDRKDRTRLRWNPLSTSINLEEHFAGGEIQSNRTRKEKSRDNIGPPDRFNRGSRSEGTTYCTLCADTATWLKNESTATVLWEMKYKEQNWRYSENVVFLVKEEHCCVFQVG